MYSTALPPAAVAAAREGLRFGQGEPGRWRRALGPAAGCRGGRVALGALSIVAPFGESGAPPFVTPIVPFVVGSAGRACRVSAALRARGILAVAIRPPTVPDGTARLRFRSRRPIRPMISPARRKRRPGRSRRRPTEASVEGPRDAAEDA
ncbi:hypothetical protein ABG088_05920, partial [Hydrogenibacillus schlegelii]